MSEQIAELLERIDALEYALDTPEWRRLTQSADQEFTRAGLRNLTELARVMRLKNPLIKRGVEIKKLYVWGQGWTVKASDKRIQEVIDAFLYDPKNDDVIGSHEARMQLEVDLETDGNLFFCFFVNRATGRVRVRTINFDEIEDVIRNPDDAKEPWFYKRLWTEQRFNPDNGSIEMVQRTAYYPDWRYMPVAQTPNAINGYPVFWDKPIYHIKVGGYSNWKFGLSEFYDAIDWAAAYKNFLEDWAAIVRAYRRFAFQLTTSGNNKVVTAAKSRLTTTLQAAATDETKAKVGGMFVAGEGYDLAPIRTSGATVSAEDGRRLLLMVAASFGLSETFFGDADIGSLATAKSLDRPTELMMEDRQTLWRDVFLNIFAFVMRWAVKAPSGALRSLGAIRDKIEDGQHNETVEWAETDDGKFVDDVSVEFPPLLQHDVPQMVTAIVQAATLGAGGQLAGTIDLPTLSRVLLTLLGVADADEIVERLFPNGEVPEEPAGGNDEQLPERTTGEE